LEEFIWDLVIICDEGVKVKVRVGCWLGLSETEDDSRLESVDRWSNMGVVLIWWGKVSCEGLRWLSESGRLVEKLGKVAWIGDKVFETVPDRVDFENWGEFCCKGGVIPVVVSVSWVGKFNSSKTTCPDK